MDDTVIRAMAKWPDVPAVYGWLALTRRGEWRLRGEPIANPAARAFISRNYGAEPDGRWFFQNGPQRVYIELEYTPWVYRLDPDGGLRTHTDLPVAEVREAWLDDAGSLLLCTERGPGVVDDRDLPALSAALVCDGRECEEDDLAALAAGGARTVLLRHREALVPVGTVRRRDCPRRFGYHPRPAPGGAPPGARPDHDPG